MGRFVLILICIVNTQICFGQFKAADYYRIANAKFNTGDLESALRDINIAIELDTANFLYYLKKGHILNRLEQEKDAIKSYTKAIELNSGNAENFYYRGITYSIIQKYKLALPDLDFALKLNPSLSTAYYYRGLVKINMRTVDEGCLDLKKFLETSFKGDVNNEKAAKVFKRRCKGF